MKVDLEDKLNLLLEANEALEILENKIEKQAKDHEDQIKLLENKIDNNKIIPKDNKLSPQKLKSKSSKEKSIFCSHDRVEKNKY